MFFTSENLVGEFAHKVASLKEQLANQLLSVVESFRKKNSEMKKDRCSTNTCDKKENCKTNLKKTFQSAKSCECIQTSLQWSPREQRKVTIEERWSLVEGRMYMYHHHHYNNKCFI